MSSIDSVLVETSGGIILANYCGHYSQDPLLRGAIHFSGVHDAAAWCKLWRLPMADGQIIPLRFSTWTLSTQKRPGRRRSARLSLKAIGPIGALWMLMRRVLRCCLLTCCHDSCYAFASCVSNLLRATKVLSQVLTEHDHVVQLFVWCARLLDLHRPTWLTTSSGQLSLRHQLRRQCSGLIAGPEDMYRSEALIKLAVHRACWSDWNLVFKLDKMTWIRLPAVERVGNISAPELDMHIEQWYPPCPAMVRESIKNTPNCSHPEYHNRNSKRHCDCMWLPCRALAAAVLLEQLVPNTAFDLQISRVSCW